MTRNGRQKTTQRTQRQSRRPKASDRSANARARPPLADRCQEDEHNHGSWPDAAWKQRFRRGLRAWFAVNARELPWRPSPGLYQTWVSEIMLQQTQVVTVIPHYRRFLARFPTLRVLAQAGEQEVLRCWEGLGYYRRARQLHAAAQKIVAEHGGSFPTSIEHVRALPGIGRYTAGAILSIALDQPHPILEANTVRVLSRLLAYRGDPMRVDGQQLLWAFAEALLPRGGWVTSTRP